jgi:hypothetical protein
MAYVDECRIIDVARARPDAGRAGSTLSSEQPPSVGQTDYPQDVAQPAVSANGMICQGRPSPMAVGMARKAVETPE